LPSEGGLTLLGRLAGAALALAILGGPGLVEAKSPTPSHPRVGVTTLEPPRGGAWRLNDDTNDTFTPVGVIGGRSLGPEADSSGLVANLPPSVSRQVPSSDPARSPTPVSRAAAWLPEPATWVLFLIGLAVIGLALRGLVAARSRLSRLEESEPES
jgi:hypothetical protein